uniref:malonyl-coenzyme A:anthocyanin 3-O-glucoside-6''-O-malonyltransferase-like n=1 Tax=Erigeron canadensis TaxID=72917 RepID=UPI001CB919FD|nr:malonyl-coenzyme A:anthocyanin 3-O-glucoside-6''-O-malonyltransferase-like [Erigeron canadensis]
MDTTPNLTLIEDCRISPPPGTVGHRSLPLTFFDTTWLLFPPVHHLFFYDFPHSKSHFVETVVPNLKHSLSLTLRHFFPFVGKLVVYPNLNNSGVIKKPEIRHVEGDYVALTFAECDLDFNDLSGYHSRKCETFYPLVPSLGKAVKKSNYVTIPLFSLKVTLFPNNGISIGMTNHHSLCDASTRYSFLKAWTSIARFGGDQSFLVNEYPPIYDRLINYPKLDEYKLSQTRLETFYKPPSLVGPTNKVRATFVLTRTNINQLKERVISELPILEYVSSFTVICGYIWSCIAKSLVKLGERKGEDELEQFIFTIDCRSRMDPPIPANYFGNCGAPCVVTIENVVLSSENGFVVASKLIGEGINKMVNNKDGIMKDVERWHDPFKIRARKIGVAGTPKLKFYNTDFGWGKPKKYETISIDYNESISINASKGSTQDVEIGLCLPSTQMEALANIFNDGLKG